MKPQFNVLLYLVKQKWDSPELDLELAAIKKFYEKTVDLTFYVQFTDASALWAPTIIKDQTSPLYGRTTMVMEESSYDRCFTKPALKYGTDTGKRIDFVCAVIPFLHWRGITGGLCSDDSQGIQQLAVRGQKGLKYLNGEMKGKSELFVHLTHELSHAIYRYLGLPDRTHAVCIGDEQYMPPWAPSDMRYTTAYSLKRSAWVRLRDFWRGVWGLPKAN